MQCNKIRPYIRPYINFGKRSAVDFQNKEKTVLIVVTDFRKLSEIVRKYVNIAV